MGWVDVARDETLRLAEFLGITPDEFEQRHVIGTTSAGEKLIKQGLQVCQFLDEDRKCRVYAARPRRCRDYHCWEQEGDDLVVYKLAAFVKGPLTRLEDASGSPR